MTLSFAAIALWSLMGAGAEASGIPLSLGTCALPDAKPGEIRTLYWELYQHSETCVSFVPEPAASGLVLTFSFTHVGREMKAPPQLVLLRAQLPPTAMLVSASVRLILDDKTEIDLTAPGREYQMTYPPHCTPPPETGCAFTGVEIPLPLDQFRRIANAKTVQVVAFGTGHTLSPATRSKLAELARRTLPRG